MNRLGIVALTIVGVIAVYKLSHPTDICRYRMTVNVEVDGQMRSSSSVIEFSVTKQMRFLPDVNPIRFDAEGEAVFVDLGGQRSLVALLRSGEYAQEGSFPLGVVPAHFKLNFARQVASLASLRGKWELADKDLPTLVTFSDANNSATLRVIRPDQLEQVFGPNVRWRGVVIEMTTDAVTHGLEARLPFLVSQRSALRSANQNPHRFIPSYDAFLRSSR
ncbi:hypothetical protein [Bradyrhizobium sp. sBnM-33]|uniref:hypothetical protein n=1 Tax=Bradyrhizobium sp. sBnM-33 TaxID=2831780 RepID=UPI001BD02782|nr:hypothetical protein [Bradyrhizobium sp. sBnM-33]WOH49344.1 hypothetical protein RX328_35585 [Bradyrhizobium sp. sBnM-33]